MPYARPTATLALAFTALAAALPATAVTAATTSYDLIDLGPASWSSDINHKGQVSGAVAGRAALYGDGAWTTRNDPHKVSAALAIDDAGDMVGEAHDADGVHHLMYYPQGLKDVVIPMPAGAGDMLGVPSVGISPNGHRVVGSYFNAEANYPHCFVWHPGKAHSVDIGLPEGYDSCEADDVDDAGQVVGRVWGAATGFSAFIYQDGVFGDVGRKSFTTATLEAINKKGHAIGNRSGGGALYFDGAKLHKIPQAGDLSMTQARAMNDRDTVVGVGSSAGHDTIARWADGMLVDVVPMIANADGWHFSSGTAAPEGINEKGRITGNAFLVDDAGKKHSRAYVLVPND
jgi:hypothetical protein